MASLTFSQIVERQRAFDASIGYDWQDRNPERQLENLKYVTIAISGEIGEIANPLKKFLRECKHNDFDAEKFAQLRGMLGEEAVDIFIYTLILASVLGIDLEQAYLEKFARNEKKFAALKK